MNLIEQRKLELISAINEGTAEEQLKTRGLIALYSEYQTGKIYLAEIEATIENGMRGRSNWLLRLHEIEMLLKAAGENLEIK